MAGQLRLRLSLVSVTFLAAISAIAVGVSGSRLRNIQVTFLSLAFSPLAVVFGLHGLTTPGMIMPARSVVGVAGLLAVVLTSAWLGLSVIPADRPGIRSLTRVHKWLVPVWTAILLGIVVSGMTMPHVIESLPLTISWWIYHVLLLLATIAMLVGLVRQYSSGASLGLSVKGLFTHDPMERIEAGISPTVRALAQGGVIHDVGKIEVPDAILGKPGPLTPEERVQIEKHPTTEYEMCKRLDFASEELEIIRHHHERWDGKG